MPNLFDYLAESQYDSFFDKDITVLDILALTELSYLPFDQLVSEDFSLENAIRLDKLAADFAQTFDGQFPPFSMVNTNRLNLLTALSQYKRYKHIKAFAYINDYNLDSQKQFAAMSFQLAPKRFVTVFRGTDDTLIGWKEDFHMTYMPEIPAQIAARDYLTELLAKLYGEFFVAGHSKGGNLATFASSQIEPVFQEKLTRIYTFDAPGVHASVIQSSGFQAIQDKLQPIIPQNSIVGMMLETPKNAVIIKSKAIGLAQHITFSWEVDGDDFQKVEALTENSLQMDKTLKTWTASLTDEELKHFFDLFFGVFTEAGILRFSDITIDTPAKLQKIIQNSQEMTSEQQAMMERLTRLLIDTRFQIWKESLVQVTKLSDISLPQPFRQLFEAKNTTKDES